MIKRPLTNDDLSAGWFNTERHCVMNKPRTKSSSGRSAAFTLIEIIVTVLILAIAATIAVPMMSSAADMQVRSAANRLAADLEYAKNMAITHQRPFTVVFNDSATADNGYAIQRRDDSNNLVTILNPISQGDFDVRFSTVRGINRVRIPVGGVSLVPDNAQDAITFDYLGTPHSDLTTTSPLNSGQITLRDTAGNILLYVNIEPMTGYITISSTP